MRFTSSDLLSPNVRAPSVGNDNEAHRSKTDEDMLQVRTRLLNYIYQNHVNRDAQRLRGITLSMELLTD